MPGDLLIITPSRGRPSNVARLLTSTHALRRAETHVHIAVDEDDPALEAYGRAFESTAADHDTLDVGPRKSLTEWTNEIALKRAGEYTCLASFGDDHNPRTPGFDKALVDACTAMGVGIAYPWDGAREDVPEAVVLSSAIVTALGWMANPVCSHWFIDDTWAALGRGAGCLAHLRAIAVDHVHPGSALGAQATWDATYTDAGARLAEDKAAYDEWRRERMAADVATVAALRKAVREPA